MTSPQLELRQLVAEAVREAVAEIVSSSVKDALADVRTAPGRTTLATGAPAQAPTVAPAASEGGRTRVESVRIASDADLEIFARHLLALFENPKNRQDLRAGRIRFRLAPGPPVSAVGGPARRVERGAVTERLIREAAEAGERIVLGPRAVLTPLGREKARALGICIEKER